MEMVTIKNGKTYTLTNVVRRGKSVIEAHNVNTGRVVTSEKVLAEIIAAHAEQSHAQALEMNAQHDEKTMADMFDARTARLCNDVEAAHAEALEMNIGVDNEISTAALAIAEIRKTTEPGDMRSSRVGAVLMALLGGLAERGTKVCPFMLSELVGRAEANKSLSQRAGEYFKRFRGVSEAQLRRFEGYAFRKMKGCAPGAFGDLWLNAEGELVARTLDGAHS